MMVIITIKLQKCVSGSCGEKKWMHKDKPKSPCVGLFALFGKTLNIYYPKFNKLIINKLISNVSVKRREQSN